MSDAVAVEQLSERAVVGVGPGVVADQPFGLDVVVVEEGECAFDEAVHVRCELLVMLEQKAVRCVRVEHDSRVGEPASRCE